MPRKIVSIRIVPDPVLLTGGFGYARRELDELDYDRLQLTVAEEEPGSNGVLFQGIGIDADGEVAAAPDITGEKGSHLAGVQAEMQERLIGETLETVDDIKRIMKKFDLEVVGNTASKCGLEQALFGIVSQIQGKSYYDLIKECAGEGEPTSPPGIDIQCTVSFKNSIEEYRSEVNELLQRRPKYIKFKVGKSKENQELVAQAIEELHRLDPSVQISVDANQAFPSAKKAAKFVKRFKESGALAWIEQPLPRSLDRELKSFRKLIAGTGVGVMLDESIHSLRDAKYFIKRGLCDAINVKPAKHGGVLETLKIINYAKRHGVKVMLGSMVHGPLGLPYMLAFGETQRDKIFAGDFYSYRLLQDYEKLGFINLAQLKATPAVLKWPLGVTFGPLATGARDRLAAKRPTVSTAGNDDVRIFVHDGLRPGTKIVKAYVDRSEVGRAQLVMQASPDMEVKFPRTLDPQGVFVQMRTPSGSFGRDVAQHLFAKCEELALEAGKTVAYAVEAPYDRLALAQKFALGFQGDRIDLRYAGPMGDDPGCRMILSKALGVRTPTTTPVDDRFNMFDNAPSRVSSLEVRREAAFQASATLKQFMESRKVSATGLATSVSPRGASPTFALHFDEHVAPRSVSTPRRPPSSIEYEVQPWDPIDNWFIHRQFGVGARRSPVSEQQVKPSDWATIFGRNLFDWGDKYWRVKHVSPNEGERSYAILESPTPIENVSVRHLDPEHRRIVKVPLRQLGYVGRPDEDLGRLVPSRQGPFLRGDVVWQNQKISDREWVDVLLASQGKRANSPLDYRSPLFCEKSLGFARRIRDEKDVLNVDQVMTWVESEMTKMLVEEPTTFWALALRSRGFRTLGDMVAIHNEFTGGTFRAPVPRASIYVGEAAHIAPIDLDPVMRDTPLPPELVFRTGAWPVVDEIELAASFQRDATLMDPLGLGFDQSPTFR